VVKVLARFLIVTADDFGQSGSINDGVVQAHEAGIVTSASLMVRFPTSREAASYARDRPQLSVGLHVDLGEWSHRDGEWVAEYEVLASPGRRQLAAEVDRQLTAFEALMGWPPTHLDSHQHVHRGEPLRSVLVERAASLRIPLRGHDPVVRYSGAFYGQSGRGEPFPEAISVEGLVATLEELPSGWTELGCHPGAEPAGSMYGAERPVELGTLCDPAVREAVRRLGIELRSFHDVPSKATPPPPAASERGGAERITVSKPSPRER
jgi:predicted glycoside hydrolase/deacetylase ChbG (UPF0249 family)